jgi:hypothetical protein
MLTLEGAREVVVAVEHVGRRRKQLEVPGVERGRSFGVCQRLVRVQPRPLS